MVSMRYWVCNFSTKFKPHEWANRENGKWYCFIYFSAFFLFTVFHYPLSSIRSHSLPSLCFKTIFSRLDERASSRMRVRVSTHYQTKQKKISIKRKSWIVKLTEYFIPLMSDVYINLIELSGESSRLEI